ncbi:MAG: hypothetical protein IPJ77_12845 [Planctomycetes bacterium]|nr:hypothetical protein [Planctomycetota bacterium]
MRIPLAWLVFLVPLAPSALGQTVDVPPVVVSSLTHEHYLETTPPQQTVTRDMVSFPCAVGDCSGPGFTASIGQGSTVVVRFEAPAGQRFTVTRAPGGTQYFTTWAHWTTGTSDVNSNFATSVVTFEDLTGTAPLRTFDQSAVSNNGQVITCGQQFTVGGDFSFTAMNVEFTVNHVLPQVPRTYGVVNSTAANSFGSSRFVGGVASDATLMRIEPRAGLVPPVVISTLAHEHFVQAGPPQQTFTRDAVQFPCAAGACNGPAFSASIGQNSNLVVRYEAPTGFKFVLTRAPGGTQYFTAWAYWQTGTNDVISNFPTASISFDDLTGPAPTSTYSLNAVSNNGHAIVSENDFLVSGGCTFTALQVEFSVGHALAAQLRAYGAVNSYSAPSFGSTRVVPGLAADATLLTLEPISANQAFCFGDGLDTSHTSSCPCGNFGATGNGCANSTQPAGANLAATGAANPDTITLLGSGMPATAACIYLQGDARGDSTFGDGVSCIAGSLIRLRTKTSVAGASQFPDSTDTVTVSQRGGVTPGSGVLRYYAAYYRNASLGFCPPHTFNITNGRILRW